MDYDVSETIEDDEHTIHILCPLESHITPEDIGNLLPAWKTHVISCEVTGDLPIVKLVMLIAAKTAEEFQTWLKQYEDKTKCSYSIKATEACSGRYVTFKRRLHCIHSTSCSRIYDPATKNRTRNTNCPATIYVKILAVKKRYQGKNKEKAPNPELPCRIVLIATHNHIIDSADVLRFRPVCDEVRRRLLDLYASGHTPATALEFIKMDIRLNYDDYDTVLADRRYCPNYMYCYHLYKKELRKQCGPMELDSDGANIIMKRLDNFNEEVGDANSAKMIIDGSHYIISICPPMLKRVHEHVKAASEMVFIDSSRTTVNHENSKIFVLLTPSECGGLPLGILIASSEHPEIISKGFELFKSMVGNGIFGGNRDGPVVFLSDESTAIRSAIQKVFVSSTYITCLFHVLRTMWKWLIEPDNEIPQTCQCTFFQQFRAVVYAKTIEECVDKYKKALSSAKDYPKYLHYLEDYWKRKEMWATAYRNGLLITEHNINIFSETVMQLVRNKIFKKARTFNLAQTIDFILTKFLAYYERQLLDAANNRQRKNIFDKNIQRPPEGLTDRIQILNDCIALVPTETTDNLFFIVNTDVLMCSCSDGSSGILCKHVDWVYYLIRLPNHSKWIGSEEVRQQFHLIATGTEPPVNLSINNEFDDHTRDDDNHTAESDMQSIALNIGLDNIKTITEILTGALETSPEEVNAGLEVLKDELIVLKTPAAIASACTSFASKCQQETIVSSTLIHPTTLKRRKFYDTEDNQNRESPTQHEPGYIKRSPKTVVNRPKLQLKKYT